MKNKKIFLLALLTLLLLGCQNNNSTSEKENAYEKNLNTSESVVVEETKEEKILTFAEYIKEDGFEVEILNLDDKLKNMEVVEFNTEDPNIDELSLLYYDDNEKLGYFLVFENEESPFKRIRVVDKKTDTFEDVSFGENAYGYVTNVRGKDGTLEGMFFGETLDRIRVKKNEMNIEKLDSFSRADIKSIPTGTFINSVKNSELKDKSYEIFTQINETRDNEDGLNLLMERKAKIEIGEDRKDKVVEGELLGSSMRLENYLAYQIYHNNDPSNHEYYEADGFLHNMETNTKYKIQGFNKFCSYFAGNENFFFCVEFPKGLNIENAGPTYFENSYLFIKEGEDFYQGYVLPGHLSTNFVQNLFVVDDENIIIYMNEKLDLINLKDKKIHRYELGNKVDEKTSLYNEFNSFLLNDDQVQVYHTERDNEIQKLYLDKKPIVEFFNK